MEYAVITKAIRQQMEALGPDADPWEARALAYAEIADSNSFRSSRAITANSVEATKRPGKNSKPFNLNA